MGVRVMVPAFICLVTNRISALSRSARSFLFSVVIDVVLKEAPGSRQGPAVTKRVNLQPPPVAASAEPVGLPRKVWRVECGY